MRASEREKRRRGMMSRTCQTTTGIKFRCMLLSPLLLPVVVSMAARLLFGITVATAFMAPPHPEEIDAYCDEVLREEMGLDFKDMQIQVEERHYADALFDPVVYAKLKVDGAHAQEAIDRMKSFSRSNCDIHLSEVPKWWKPSPSAERFVYSTGEDSASVFVVYVDACDGAKRFYVARITC